MTDEDAKFQKSLEQALPTDTLADHRGHIDRMLKSSPYPDPWGKETTMIRIGLRRSVDPKLQSPKAAAEVIEGLIETLMFFMKEGDSKKMENLFFDMLDGMATHPKAFVALSKFADLRSSAKVVGQGHVEEPAGSDVSEVEEPRDSRNAQVDSESEFETPLRREEDAVDYFSTGEVYGS